MCRGQLLYFAKAASFKICVKNNGGEEDGQHFLYRTTEKGKNRSKKAEIRSKRALTATWGNYQDRSESLWVDTHGSSWSR
jgi:hypothetical protein